MPFAACSTGRRTAMGSAIDRISSSGLVSCCAVAVGLDAAEGGAVPSARVEAVDGEETREERQAAEAAAASTANRESSLRSGRVGVPEALTLPCAALGEGAAAVPITPVGLVLVLIVSVPVLIGVLTLAPVPVPVPVAPGEVEAR